MTDPPTPWDQRAEGIRLALKAALADRVSSWRIPQALAADRLGIGRSTLNNILNHDNRRISIGALVTMLLRAGAEVSVIVDVADVEVDGR